MCFKKGSSRDGSFKGLGYLNGEGRPVGSLNCRIFKILNLSYLINLKGKGKDIVNEFKKEILVGQ